MIDERAARLVAGGVAIGALVALVLWPPLAGVLALGFALRVGWGPRWSPWARFVTSVVVPRLGGESRLVAGPPKRFAQAIGLVFSAGAFVAVMLGAGGVASGLLAVLVLAASLEAVFGVCLGCVVFALLMRVGVIPDGVCAECADITRRISRP